MSAAMLDYFTPWGVYQKSVAKQTSHFVNEIGYFPRF